MPAIKQDICVYLSNTIVRVVVDQQSLCKKVSLAIILFFVDFQNSVSDTTEDMLGSIANMRSRYLLYIVPPPTEFNGNIGKGSCYMHVQMRPIGLDSGCRGKRYQR